MRLRFDWTAFRRPRNCKIPAVTDSENNKNPSLTETYVTLRQSKTKQVSNLRTKELAEIISRTFRVIAALCELSLNPRLDMF